MYIFNKKDINSAILNLTAYENAHVWGLHTSSENLKNKTAGSFAFTA